MDDFVAMRLMRWLTGPGVFFSQSKALFRKSVMIGSGVLIQMRFTLSMV